MIKKIVLNNAATFKNPVEILPRRINYIYGGNGSGKTTISRVIDNPEDFSHSFLEWENTQLEAFVYNRDFIKENFEQDSIKGIFTLGKDVPDAEAKILQKTTERQKYDNHILGLNNTIEKKEEELTSLEQSVVEDCWKIKLKHSEKIKQSLAGYLSRKNAFFDKCKDEQGNENDLVDINVLEEKNIALYKREIAKIDKVTNINITQLDNIEQNDLFSEPIIGKENSTIGKLISHLSNSDWVHEGIGYFKNTIERKCPYCQQEINPDLAKEIENYFDQTFLRKSRDLEIGIESYKTYVTGIFQQIDNILVKTNELYDFDNISKELKISRKIYESNLLLLETKKSQKSHTIALETLKGSLSKIISEVDNCNNAINDHNKIIDNIGNEKKDLTELCWRFLAEESKTIIDRYNKNKLQIETIINGMKSKIEEETEAVRLLNIEIATLESQITSVEHSANEINRILKGFHFAGFELKESSVKGHYQVVREDGSIANRTLSEGEYTFITFLYFYYLIKGSNSESGINNKRIVVIDDPISSLDSSVLFIVSNLVKSIIDDLLNNYRKSLIRQLFILTHNIYFHKEVSFKGQRENTSAKEFFWIVYKTDNTSKIKTNTKNPINTTYSILWDDIKNCESTNRVTVFNNLRRILEYYFKIIGNYNYEEMINKFEFEDQQTCKALISWINDGSHFINDDLLIETEIESVERYLSIFKDIFDKLGHISHYNMMMGIK